MVRLEGHTVPTGSARESSDILPAFHEETTVQASRDAMEIPGDAGRSWWLLDALAADPGAPAPPLDADTTADVVVMGGGYTGMWTAWFLKESEPDLDVVLLEQDICGGGPSGRNGGFVNSWWSAVAELARRFGDARALALCLAGEESVRAIGRFCDEHAVDAWYRPDGDLGAASSEAQIGYWADNVIAADRLGMPDLFRVVDRHEVRELIDTPRLHGGILTAMGATVQPARLARGIRRMLLERGVRIFEQTPVTRFGAGSPSVAETPRGTVRAGAAVVALNAWAAHWKRFRRLLTVRGSYIALTAPAPEKLETLGWTNGMGLWDHRAALHYVRTTPDGRIAFGIGGMQPGLARTIGPRFAWDERAVRVAAEDLYRMFPSFEGVPIDAAWGGPIDVAGHHLPFFGSLDRGSVHYGLGFTGNGVGPSHLGGQILAAKALGRASDLLSLPVVTERPMRFPPEPVRSPGAFVANQAIWRKDQLEDRGEEASPIVDFVAHLPRRLGYNLGP
jgi:glycine/D-amino acid oxidase-like deaminating enzyme